MATSHVVASHITKLLSSFRQILEFRFRENQQERIPPWKVTKTKQFLSTCYGDPSATEVHPCCEAASKKLTFSTTSVLLLLNVPLSLSRGTIFRRQKNPRRGYRPKIAGILFVCNEPGRSIPYCAQICGAAIASKWVRTVQWVSSPESLWNYFPLKKIIFNDIDDSDWPMAKSVNISRGWSLLWCHMFQCCSCWTDSSKTCLAKILDEWRTFQVARSRMCQQMESRLTSQTPGGLRSSRWKGRQVWPRLASWRDWSTSYWYCHTITFQWRESSRWLTKSTQVQTIVGKHHCVRSPYVKDQQWSTVPPTQCIWAASSWR